MQTETCTLKLFSTVIVNEGDINEPFSKSEAAVLLVVVYKLVKCQLP